MTNGQDGDGVVLVSSAELQGAKTFYYEGSCNGFNYFHNTMLRPKTNKDIYNKIIEILES